MKKKAAIALLVAFGIILAWAPWLSDDDARRIVKGYVNFQEQQGHAEIGGVTDPEIHVAWTPFCRFVTTFEGGWLACFWQSS